MFSGKTTMLISEITKYADIGFRVAYINSKLDNRQTESKDGYVTTHSSQFLCLSSKIRAFKLNRLSEISQYISLFDVIGIDEAQFFSDLFSFVFSLLKKGKHRILISSLDADSNMKKFGQALDLLPFCSYNGLIRVSSFCLPCRKKNELVFANVSFRKASRDTNESNIEIKASDKYEPLCLKCYFSSNS
jgi:thymidine kinase